MKINKTLKSNIFFFLAAIIWGFAFVAQCDAGDSINLFWLIAFRYVLGSASLIPIILLYENRKEKKAEVKVNNKTTILAGAICGTILFIASALQQWGINVNPNAGKAGFITGTYTVLVPIICLILFRKKTGINVLLGAICAVIGLYLLSVQNGIGNIGFADIVLFIGACFWAFHIITIDRFIDKVSLIKFSSVQFLVCVLWGLICLIVTGNLNFPVMISQIEANIIPLLYMGLCSSGIAYTCQVLGQRDADPTYSAIILSTESVFAAVGGVLFGIDKGMNLRSYIGCAVIFIGILLSQISFEKKNKKE
ncbi:MAG: DMT family transporter [Clostridia bacterium]|nr:DMT family transporter [Clostridia bacterium]